MITGVTSAIIGFAFLIWGYFCLRLVISTRANRSSVGPFDYDSRVARLTTQVVIGSLLGVSFIVNAFVNP